jgi:hypothetical protein
VIRPASNTAKLLLLSTVDWESALVRHFLHTGADGEASPIRSFEITAETLALASGVGDASASEAEAAFKEALLADPDLWGALRHGRSREPMGLVPNCFIYLAMTLLIDTLLEGAYSTQGQFRDRLRTWLDTARSVMDLSGVALMWHRLADWIDEKVDEGEPLRRVVLPSPGTWNQIGYTRRLSFPTRADARFLDRILANFEPGFSDPPGLIRAIAAAMSRGGASWGMNAAFEEFRSAFRAGTASTNHRFWRFLIRSATSSGKRIKHQAIVELVFDEDSRRTIFTGSSDDDANLTAVKSLADAMTSEVVIQSANLGIASSRGVIFFRQVGTARWTAQSTPPLSGSSVVYLGLSMRWAHTLGFRNVSLDHSGEWLLTKEPLGPRKLSDLLARVHFPSRTRDQVLDTSLVGGVRVGIAWLGRKAFLPRIEAGGGQQRMTRLPGQEDGANVTVRDGLLLSDDTVVGKYEISGDGGGENGISGWSRHVRFFADAIPHDELTGAAYKEPTIREWLSDVSAKPAAVRSSELAWNDDDHQSADILEAIYASGRSGLSEMELLDVLGRGADGKVDLWSLLRTIQESGFIQARLRSGWRGRVWTLQKPHLVPVNGGEQNVFVVEGALCAALEREFRDVVTNMGGKAFRHIRVSSWAPPVVGAVGTDSNQLAQRLGWVVAAAPANEPRFQPIDFEHSNLTAAHHELASSWSWNDRHFIAEPISVSDVSLTRWVHPGGRDHDVYRVQSPIYSSFHMTRTAAILNAHIVARVPIFSFVGDTLIRKSKEGALPLEFARWLRLISLAGSGLIEDGKYGYPITREDAAKLAQALPGCIDGITLGSSLPSTVKKVVAVRRSGRKRLSWMNGTLMVTD